MFNEDPLKKIDELIEQAHIMNKKFEFRQQNAVYIPVKQVSETLPIKVLVDCEHEECYVDDDIPTCYNCGEVNDNFDWGNHYSSKHDNLMLARGFNL